MVLRPFKYVTFVRRPVMGTKGIGYKFAWFLNAELETLQEQTARAITNIQARNQIAGAEFGSDQVPAPFPFKKPS